MTEIRTFTKTVEVPQYQVGDKTFDTPEAAQREQQRLRELSDPVLRYQNNAYNAKQLFAQISLDEKGTFLIEDEGPVDGYGRPSRLAIVHGTLRNAIKYAFTLPRFVGYGPGNITLLDIIEV